MGVTKIAINSSELEPGWKLALEEELKKPYISELAALIKQQRAAGIEIYPPEYLVFNAFQQTPYDKVRVLIMGQDPYHGPEQAHGLSFSVAKGVKTPPSLKNIYKELTNDVGFTPPEHGCLESWARQGVMLLNATLTVERGNPMSHHGKGWELFTDAAIRKLVERDNPIAFVLWGRSAKEKCERILSKHHHKQNHLILKAAHPSPFSARNGFFGCKHFSKVNQFLIEHGCPAIEWQL